MNAVKTVLGVVTYYALGTHRNITREFLRLRHDFATMGRSQRVEGTQKCRMSRYFMDDIRSNEYVPYQTKGADMKRKQFYAWAGKRSDPEKRKQFYAWAGK
ncbi:hypothetical protein TELCIR_02421 [Teladorsagia circumcincta]|uniref:Uncharacterized protein n=1 Tax=Teladorsagia circumcincta TaxID=45464 RepID=A0A2G9V0P2_TELCI|nr:hypothetical protein TELCIR_02421 [Teladorsagia circumcincta]